MRFGITIKGEVSMVSQKRGRSPGRPKVNETARPTNEQILSVATRLFLESGFQKVSIDDVAKKAGMTKATVYYYFESKGELFKEAIVALMLRVRGRIDTLLNSQLPFYTRLLEVAKAHLQATTSIDLSGFMRESHTSLTEDQVEAMKRAEEQMFQRIEQGFQEAIESGEIAMVDPKFAAHAYINLLRVGNYKAPNGTLPFGNYEETAEKIMSLLWNGLFEQ